MFQEEIELDFKLNSKADSPLSHFPYATKKSSKSHLLYPDKDSEGFLFMVQKVEVPLFNV